MKPADDRSARLLKPRTFRQGMRAIPRFFNTDGAAGVEATIRFVVDGEEPGDWWMRIQDGRLQVGEGEPTELADLIIRTPSQVWLRIMCGELNGAEAFLSGQAVATGDVDLLVGLPGFFRFRIPSPEK